MAATRLLRAAGFDEAAIASKLAPTAFAPGKNDELLREAAVAAEKASTRRCAVSTAAVGVRRPLPQNTCSRHGSGAILVGAALAATRLLRAAGFDEAAIASKLAPTAFAPGKNDEPLREAAVAAEKASTRRCALPTAAVGVRRPLPQNTRSGHGSGAILVGAALAATPLLRAAGF
ncbi:hypothetical protein [Methyloversatilis discipulorum]|uniref:hypothetical protein n=1 Tax=Methyloversatilis discipulorum TaxID=1119528 RepID=UPI0026EC0BEF|nr:hypothetical protein [Methyloversatilis discipulorum]